MKKGDLVCWHNYAPDWGIVIKVYKDDVFVLWVLDNEQSCVPKGAVRLVGIK